MYRIVIGLLIWISLSYSVNDDCIRRYYENGYLKSVECYIKDNNITKKIVYSVYGRYGGHIRSKYTYDANGTLLVGQRYLMGLLDNESIHKDGKEVERRTYYKTGVLRRLYNKKVDKEFYPNGQIAIDKNGNYPLTRKEFVKVYRGTTFKLREPITKQERKKLVGTPYKNIEKNYDFRKYSSSGDIIQIIPYRNNKKEGLAVKLYYKRGYYLKTTMYKNDKKEGYETIYKKKGKLHDRKIQSLLNDDSNCSMYDESDVLVSKVLYKQGRKVDE